MHRRAFISGIVASLAAPAIVRADSIMRVAALRESIKSVPLLVNPEWIDHATDAYRYAMMGLQAGDSVLLRATFNVKTKEFKITHVLQSEVGIA